MRSVTVVDVVDTYVVACSSTLSDFDVSLRTVYVADPEASGNDGVEGTAVTMLASAPRHGLTELHQHQREPGEVPVVVERRHCLHDHLLLLNGWATHVLDAEILIDVSDRDLEAVDLAVPPRL